MNTTRTATGDAYRPRRLVSGPVENFARILSHYPGQSTPPTRGVTVYDIAAINGATRRHFEPSHPHADSDGFITLPAVSQAEEMTLLIKTTRAYEANLVALSAAQQIYSSALQVGRQA